MDLLAPAGSPVRAAAPGEVVFAGQVAGRGVVSIALTGTGTPPLRITYEPVRPSVKKGRRVRAGERIGTLSATTLHCGMPCLHWGLLRAERYLDPLSLLPLDMLRSGPSRLLPVFGVPLPDGPATVSRTGRDGNGRRAHASSGPPPGTVRARLPADAGNGREQRPAVRPARDAPAPSGRGPLARSPTAPHFTPPPRALPASVRPDTSPGTRTRGPHRAGDVRIPHGRTTRATGYGLRATGY